jgi:hypothetical protein
VSATSVTLRGRAFAKARMLDTCAVTRPGAPTTDPDTGVVTPTTTTIYTGKCRIRQAVVMDRPLESGQAQRYVQHSILSVPIASPVLLTDDIVTFTASALTANLVGRTWHVRGVSGDTDATAARYEVIEVTS